MVVVLLAGKAMVAERAFLLLFPFGERWMVEKRNSGKKSIL